MRSNVSSTTGIKVYIHTDAGPSADDMEPPLNDHEAKNPTMEITV